MADKLSLEILIKTIADAQGIDATKDGIKQVTAEFEAAAKAGKPLEISAENVAEKLKKVGNDAGKIKAPIEDVAGATKRVGDASKSTAQNLGDLQTAGNSANQMMAGLERASRGGMDGILGAATAVRGFIGVLRSAAIATGPIGLAAAAIGGIAAACFLVNKEAEPAKESLEDLAKEADRLAGTRLTTLQDELKSVAKEADAARRKFDAAAAAAEKLDNAEQAAELAELRANPNLSEEQKTLGEAKIRSDFRARDQRRERDKNEFEVAQTGRSVERATDATRRPTEDLKIAIEKLAALEETNRLREADRDRLSELRKQGFPVANQDEIDAIGRRLNAGKDVDPAAIAAAKERVTTAIGPVDAARAAEASAQAAAREAKARRDQALEVQSKDNDFFARETTANLATTLPKARATDAAALAADQETKKQIEDITKARDAEKKAISEQINAINESLRGQNFNDPAFKAAEQQRDALLKTQSESERKYQTELAKLKASLSTASDDYARSILAHSDKIVNASAVAAAKLNGTPVPQPPVTTEPAAPGVNTPPIAPLSTTVPPPPPPNPLSKITFDGVDRPLTAAPPKSVSSSITTPARQVIPITSETSVKEAKAAGAISTSPASAQPAPADTAAQEENTAALKDNAAAIREPADVTALDQNTAALNENSAALRAAAPSSPTASAPTASAAAVTPSAASEQVPPVPIDNQPSATPNAGMERVAQTVASLPPVEALQTDALEQALRNNGQQVARALQVSNQKIGQLAAVANTQAGQIADLGRQIASINVSIRNISESRS